MIVTFTINLEGIERTITQQDVRTIRQAGRSIVLTLDNGEQFSMPRQWIVKIEIRFQ